jgi:hypothetical protein
LIKEYEEEIEELKAELKSAQKVEETVLQATARATVAAKGFHKYGQHYKGCPGIEEQQLCGCGYVSMARSIG